MPPAIVVASSAPSRLSTSASTRAAISATAAAGSAPRAVPAPRPRAATAVGGGRPRRPEVVRAGGDLDGRGRTSEVRLDRQQGTARVTDEGADVPLAQARPVPPITDERGRGYEPLRGVGARPTRVVPRELHAREASRVASVAKHGRAHAARSTAGPRPRLTWAAQQKNLAAAAAAASTADTVRRAPRAVDRHERLDHLVRRAGDGLPVVPRTRDRHAWPSDVVTLPTQATGSGRCPAGPIQRWATRRSAGQRVPEPALVLGDVGGVRDQHGLAAGAQREHLRRAV